MGLAPPLPPPGFRLSGWQERHALLVLARVDALQGLRFALCPKCVRGCGGGAQREPQRGRTARGRSYGRGVGRRKMASGRRWG